jgi:CubicO group peptidase (beta-lactamase class C family)
MKRTLIVILLLAVPVAAGELRNEVERLVRPYLDSGTVVGLSVGVVRGDRGYLGGFGCLGEGQGLPDGDTVYEIGSASKVFTGILLASMVADGTVRLDQPVSELLPEGTKVPAFGDRAITLLDLATQTSALPRMPDNFAPKDPANPYADYTAEQMYEFLSRCRLEHAPGTKFGYSNLGVGLLGHALSLAAGKSYEELLAERIARTLEMASTSIRLSEDQRARLAPGHDAGGKRAANWDIPTLAGAGAIRSTARDMLRFLRANLSDDETLAAAREKRFDGPPAVGLCWIFAADGITRWHNGQTGGYHSFVAVLPERRIAVVVLANTASMQVDRLGNQLILMLAGQKVEPATFREEVEVDPEVLADYVGVYRLAPAFLLTVTLESGRLMIQATGQPKLPVYPESETKFFYRVVDAQVTFRRDAEGKVTGLTLHQGGRELPAPREER